MHDSIVPSELPVDTDEIVLVDEFDRPVGYSSKLPPHQDGGRLHRAFSVFLFDSQGRVLLQQRAAEKYHFGGLWTNACCSHPRRDQPVAEAARARLRYELGIDLPLRPLFSFIYRAEDPESGLTEHELDHIFIGDFDGTPQPRRTEVADWEWADPQALLRDILRRPGRYTPWFRLVLDRVLSEFACRRK
ncbi:isopentenyl-diphosphate Delta-isomerase [Humisphaera borealis]|uniref:Isopentenyl-diphosphate delta-isomerase n=1 Tax=Humisphaera borealis TaxID=2807512 RepID=A0A7M2WZ78_9BACT|nr:isopentenyl-diphosphate Delta-isomerase [Humisphaera borealis]QOV90739.1 isopentenyl-diphosphate Delta-isomerase [Humisphaera borealis]